MKFLYVALPLSSLALGASAVEQALPSMREGFNVLRSEVKDQLEKLENNLSPGNLMESEMKLATLEQSVEELKSFLPPSSGNLATPQAITDVLEATSDVPAEFEEIIADVKERASNVAKSFGQTDGTPDLFDNFSSFREKFLKGVGEIGFPLSLEEFIPRDLVAEFQKRLAEATADLAETLKPMLGDFQKLLTTAAVFDAPLDLDSIFSGEEEALGFFQNAAQETAAQLAQILESVGLGRVGVAATENRTEDASSDNEDDSNEQDDVLRAEVSLDSIQADIAELVDGWKIGLPDSSRNINRIRMFLDSLLNPDRTTPKPTAGPTTTKPASSVATTTTTTTRASTA